MAEEFVYRVLPSGRQIGDQILARCEQDGCDETITLSAEHACGEMHGENHQSCARYFCGDHLFYNGRTFVCQDCLDRENE